MIRKNHILFLMLGVFFFAMAPVKQANAGWIELFFPMLKVPGPEDTLRAPFADQDAVVTELDANGNKENQTPLHLKHRTNEKMTIWVQHKLPIVLNYTAANYQEEYKERSKYFSQGGLAEYNKFLQDANILKTLDTGAYDVSGFITGYPVILKHEAVANRFKWVYQMEVMITYIKSGTKNLLNLKENESISRRYEVTFQLGRTRDSGNEAGVLVESWGVRAIGEN